ncbi:MAG: redox-regulated ATPase YchF, partial [Bacteroidales bacterium]|nr:redox-regulated ATPase YchF [Bacteroidales bacterium]
MALKAGIVGLPNVVKSTLFNCLSSAKAQAANFPFCTIDAQLGQVSVPDDRLTKLAELVHPGRIVPAVCDIVDIAGLVKGASQGEGLGNQFLGNIRECDSIIHVLRCFDNGNIVHVDGSVDPVRDKEIIDTELQLKDLETVEQRIKKTEKLANVGHDKNAKVEYGLLLRYKEALEKGLSARTVVPENDEEVLAAKNMFLLTTKPVLYVCNVDDASAKTGNAYVERVKEAIKEEDAELMIISAQTEADIAELESYEEKQMFLDDLGLEESGCNR